MSRWIALPLLLIFVLWPTGCGSEKEKNINKDQDKPKAADKKQIAN